VIVYITPSSGTESNPVDTTDWSVAGSQQIIRQCPKCLNHSVNGHGWRPKQSHDEQYDRIKIRRGLCKQCSTPITFLPWFSLPYTHYSLRARSQSMRLYFVEGRPLDKATPTLKDPNRIPAGCTICQWFRKLDSPERLESLQEQMAKWPPAANTSSSIVPARQRRSFQFLQKIVSAVSDRLAYLEGLCYGQSILSWQTVAHFLHTLLPLRC
jgi:hypothetical protein